MRVARVVSCALCVIERARGDFRECNESRVKRKSRIDRVGLGWAGRTGLDCSGSVWEDYAVGKWSEMILYGFLLFHIFWNKDDIFAFIFIVI